MFASLPVFGGVRGSTNPLCATCECRSWTERRWARCCTLHRARTVGPGGAAASAVGPGTAHRSVDSLVVEIDSAGDEFVMSGAGVRIGVGTRVMYDGALHEVTEWLPTVSGTDVVLRGPSSVCRMSVVELVSSARVRLLLDTAGPESTDDIVPAAVLLSSLSKEGARGSAGEGRARPRSAHRISVRKPRHRRGRRTAPPFHPSRPLRDRYGQGGRSGRRRTYRPPVGQGVPGERGGRSGPCTICLADQIDPRWSEAALAIMREHTEESKPSEKAVIYQTSKRLEICFGHGVVPEPSRATAYRELKRLEAQHRTFRGPPRATGISPRDRNGRTGNCSRPDRAST